MRPRSTQFIEEGINVCFIRFAMLANTLLEALLDGYFGSGPPQRQIGEAMELALPRWGLVFECMQYMAQGSGTREIPSTSLMSGKRPAR